jgi:[protein-PII] uridylyltransferase
VKKTETPSEGLSSPPATPSSVVADFLRERESLMNEATPSRGVSGFGAPRRYSDLMDRFISSVLYGAGLPEGAMGAKDQGLAVFALGSYGRRELCFGSDVDLLVLHQGRLQPGLEEEISHGLYVLWDAKLEVGHAVMTIPECIRLAMSDFRVLSSVLDARRVMGSPEIDQLFQNAFWPRLDREKQTLLGQFLVYEKRREERYGKEDLFVEPDLKEGLGGLRDFHFMSWMARIYFKCRNLREIRRFALFSHFDVGRLTHSKRFLLHVRNQLHSVAGRREDRLLMDLQQKLAYRLGYGDDRSLTAVERFMQQVYLHLNRIRYGYELFQAKTLDIVDPGPSEAPMLDEASEFRVFKGNLVLRKEGLSEKSPLIIMRAFDEANRRGLFLGSGFVWEARKRLAVDGKALAHMREAKDLFLGMILNPANPRIIRLALEVGLIDLFIPEFRRIRNLALSDVYHVETVDLHSLRTLEVIAGISIGLQDGRSPLYKKVFAEIADPRHLFLAGLLHDIGKGYGDDHAVKGAEIIPRILKRLDVDGKGGRLVSFLVTHHLLLARISQRRDLSDEKTVVQVAQTIQDLDLLNMLFLLTIADSLATGPMARSDWKLMLLTELYFKVRKVLEGETLATPDATHRIEVRKKELLYALSPDYPQGALQELMDQVSTRYFLIMPPEVMTAHFRMALNMGAEPFYWVLRKVEGAPVTRITLCIHDRPGLFSKMVGVFAINNIRVLSANILTLKNGLAFDVYEVTNPLDPFREAEKWDRVRDEINMVLDDRLPLDDLIHEKGRTSLSVEKSWRSRERKVKIENTASDFFTVIEVSAEDRTGLLYELAKTLHGLGLDIRFAKVNSDEEKMTGVFYVKDAGGQKVQDLDQIREIENKLKSTMKG